MAGKQEPAGQIHTVEHFAGVGEAAARAAGRYLMEHFHGSFRVARKGEIDLVTEIDIGAEKLIVSRIKEAFPSHAVIAEEMYANAAHGDCTWIIDPLDGTTNYAHGFPVFSVSIAMEMGGVLQWGAVYNPNLDEMFIATRSHGARLNGEPVRVSTTDSLAASLLATGFPYDIRTSDRNNLDYFHDFALRSQGIRRTGSAALDLCCVAAGRFDGFWELSLNPWDVAAGYLIVREAGGQVTNWRGEPGSIDERECLATNGRIHKSMMAVLHETASRRPAAERV